MQTGDAKPPRGEEGAGEGQRAAWGQGARDGVGDQTGPTLKAPNPRTEKEGRLVLSPDFQIYMIWLTVAQALDVIKK